MSAFLPPVHEPPYAMSIFDVAPQLLERDAVARVARRRDHRRDLAEIDGNVAQ